MFINWEEAQEEIKRDLAEMGFLVKPKSMQDKVIEGKEEYETKELQNYSYTLLNADSSKIFGVIQPWADKEFEERIDESGSVNPGTAWLERKEVWDEYMHDGKMAYTYNERFFRNNQLKKIVERLKEDHDSRQLWLSVWDPNEDPNKLGGISRVPCSLGYNFQFRDEIGRAHV